MVLPKPLGTALQCNDKEMTGMSGVEKEQEPMRDTAQRRNSTHSPAPEQQRRKREKRDLGHFPYWLTQTQRCLLISHAKRNETLKPEEHNYQKGTGESVR